MNNWFKFTKEKNKIKLKKKQAKAQDTKEHQLKYGRIHINLTCVCSQIIKVDIR